MFVAGIAVVGLAHQVVWLATTDERLLDSGGVQAAHRTQSRYNLREIGLALHNYHDEWKAFPPGGTFDELGAPQHSWQTWLLPFVDQAPLFRQIDVARPWDHRSNHAHFEHVLHVYLNPGVRRGPDRDSRGYALSHYAANGRVLGGGFGLSLSQITDGAENTIAAGEVAANFRPWGDPLNWRDPARGINRDPDGFGSPFTGGAHFLLTDGSVRFVSESIDPAVLKALATPEGGEDLPESAW